MVHAENCHFRVCSGQHDLPQDPSLPARGRSVNPATMEGPDGADLAPQEVLNDDDLTTRFRSPLARKDGPPWKSVNRRRIANY